MFRMGRIWSASVIRAAEIRAFGNRYGCWSPALLTVMIEKPGAGLPGLPTVGEDVGNLIFAWRVARLTAKLLVRALDLDDLIC